MIILVYVNTPNQTISVHIEKKKPSLNQISSLVRNENCSSNLVD